MPSGLYSLLAQASASGSRSTALNIVHWLFALTIGALFAAVSMHVPDALVFLLAGFCAIAFTLECFGFLYLLFNNPDALRSERFTIEKMRIEKGVMGDSLSGFRETEPADVIETAPIDGRKRLR